MALTPYSKTVWINGSTPAINSTNLNKIENQLQATTSETIVIQISLTTITSEITVINAKLNDLDAIALGGIF